MCCGQFGLWTSAEIAFGSEPALVVVRLLCEWAVSAPYLRGHVVAASSLLSFCHRVWPRSRTRRDMRGGAEGAVNDTTLQGGVWCDRAVPELKAMGIKQCAQISSTYAVLPARSCLSLCQAGGTVAKGLCWAVALHVDSDDFSV